MLAQPSVEIVRFRQKAWPVFDYNKIRVG